jgi:hypothetical protein
MDAPGPMVAGISPVNATSPRLLRLARNVAPANVPPPGAAMPGTTTAVNCCLLAEKRYTPALTPIGTLGNRNGSRVNVKATSPLSLKAG